MKIGDRQSWAQDSASVWPDLAACHIANTQVIAVITIIKVDFIIGFNYFLLPSQYSN